MRPLLELAGHAPSELGVYHRLALETSFPTCLCGWLPLSLQVTAQGPPHWRGLLTTCAANRVIPFCFFTALLTSCTLLIRVSLLAAPL